MKAAIMQPYLFPYIGYFQLIHAVDKFVVYDQIEYSKGGWINRNRILANGVDRMITLPLAKGSDFSQINERRIAPSWKERESKKMLVLIQNSYRKAPFFEPAFDLIRQCLIQENENLFEFIYHSLEKICEYLQISTPLIRSSEVETTVGKAGQDRVIGLVKDLGADIYINPIGGTSLYQSEVFRKEGIELFFLKANSFAYSQQHKGFVPFLSIIDVMMNNSREEIAGYLNNQYTLIQT